MDTPPSNGFVLELWHVIIGAVGFAATWAWKFVTGNIQDLRNSTVTKDDFKTYTDDAKQKRDELRTAVIDLYKGQKEVTQAVHDMRVELLNAIHEVKK